MAPLMKMGRGEEAAAPSRRGWPRCGGSFAITASSPTLF
jgi:hypothetical protein